MKYKKLRLKTTTQALDYMGAIAMDLGLEGFEIEDNVPLTAEEKASMFIDILPELPPDEGVAYVSFYVEPDTDEAELEGRLRDEAADYAGFCDFGEMSLEVSLTDENDWINNWKEFFKPFRIDEQIVIKPTWEAYTPEEGHEGDLVIEIDPGTAFGTGAHESTKLCILALKKYLKGAERVLDIGCGSGILSIAALKLGAAFAVGIDVDRIAVDTSLENAEVNHINAVINDDLSDFKSITGENVTDGNNGDALRAVFSCGNVISDESYAGKAAEIFRGGVDIVVANILADVIIPLSAVVPGMLKKGGVFISSGIINTKEEAVKEALKANGFEVAEVMRMNDWVSVIGTCK